MLSRDTFYALGRPSGSVDRAEGLVTRDITDANDMMYVICDALAPGQEFGPIPWPGPHGATFPQRGDRAALMVFDDIWCVGWWPNG